MDYVPEKVIKADNILNKTMLGLNIAFPTLFSCTQFIGNFYAIEYGIQVPKWINILNRSSNILTVLLQVMSGVFLFYAIFKIKQIITNEDKQFVNIKTMAIHSVSFGLYIIAIIVTQVFWILANKATSYESYLKRAKNEEIAEIVCNCASLIA